MFKKIVLSSLMLSGSAFAGTDSSFYDPVDGKFDMGNYLAENAYGFLPVPVIITEPAVGFGGGIAGLFLHESEEEKAHRQEKAMASLDGGAQLIPPAMTAVGALATENGSWFAFAGHRHSWQQDHIRYTVIGGAGKVNFDLYSNLGGLLPVDKPVSFDTQTTAAFASQKLLFRIPETQLMLGVKQFWAQSSISSSNQIVDWIFQQTLGEHNTSSGLGLAAEYDTRDNIFYPSKGYLVSAEYMSYNEALGSDYLYDSFEISGQSFWPVAEKWTLAVAGNYQAFYAKDDALPPTVKPYIDLRGVSSYRYQGDQTATLQTQVMYHLNHRWTLSGFYGLGYTYQDNAVLNSSSVNAMTESASDELISAYGVGFRYQIARRYGIHMGVDIAFSEEQSALYFNVGSGF
ncbi:BamA/TamA family outer membrane protein [Shewanella sp. KT0246]|uniref:BamA/TamA family outer membrane protein n=1 Tax=Shewanella sp. KT0246 TaxID=2815912 RepID=UPI001BC6CC2A|nr:BamA/TamA family outer membrane protein [Shewanella sp. KT0246]GIU49493.1 glyceraldehyde-3-phosphate dehydrogenase [Shewanella sp. KT0246]